MKDKCVCCKRDTLYNKDTHVDFRIGYIDTAGQLCLDFNNHSSKTKRSI